MAVVANDSFTAANGTNITARASDSGHTWTYAPGSSGNATIQSNAAVDAINANPWAYSSYTPTSADYSVSMDMLVDVATASVGGPMGRVNTTTGLGYEVYWSGGAGLWVLSNMSGNLGTYSGDAPTTLRTVTLDMVGSTIRVLIGGVQRISVTNTTHTDAGRPGAVFIGGSAARTHDNWTVEAVLPPSGPVFDSAIFSAPPFDTGVAGPTIVSGSFAGAWSVANIVSTTKVGAFSVRNYATGSQTAAFSVRASVAGSAAGAWSVRNSVAGSQSAAFSVRNYATGSADGAWSVAGGTTIVSGSAGGAWSVRNLAAATFSAASSVRNAASATQAGAWSVRAAVSASAVGAWSVRNYASGSLSAAWSVGGPVTAEWSGAWSVEQQASNSTGGGYGGGRRPKRFYTVEIGGKRRIFLDPTEALAALNADTATEAPQPVEAVEKAPTTRKQRKQAAQALKAAPQVVEVPLQPVQEWAALRGMLDQYEAAVEQMRLGELVALVEMMRDEEDVELLLLHA